MKKVKLSLNYKGLDYSGLVVFATGIQYAMNGNVNFTNASYLIGLLATAITDLDAAIKAPHPLTAELEAKRMQLEKILYALKAQVELECANNEQIAQSSGFALQAPKTRIAKSFSVKQGMVSGTADLACSAYLKRAGYIWEYIEDPINTNNWEIYDYTVVASLHVTSLTPGSKYWFRVKLVTSEGHHEYSDPYMLHVI